MKTSQGVMQSAYELKRMGDNLLAELEAFNQEQRTKKMNFSFLQNIISY